MGAVRRAANGHGDRGDGDDRRQRRHGDRSSESGTRRGGAHRSPPSSTAARQASSKKDICPLRVPRLRCEVDRRRRRLALFVDVHYDRQSSTRAPDVRPENDPRVTNRVQARLAARSRRGMRPVSERQRGERLWRGGPGRSAGCGTRGGGRSPRGCRRGRRGGRRRCVRGDARFCVPVLRRRGRLRAQQRRGPERLRRLRPDVPLGKSRDRRREGKFLGSADARDHEAETGVLRPASRHLPDHRHPRCSRTWSQRQRGASRLAHPRAPTGRGRDQ